MPADMTVAVKIGRKEGFVSSYNLFFPSGLRLKTDDLTFVSSEDRQIIRQQFDVVVTLLRASGWTVEGTIVEKS